ncbi:MAG: lipid-A-disaccharide synthase [Gammaproteobacteria bacterium]|nr:lipid-A-disaccharide synthase [Gammaproteobacteria bacterium]
MLLIGIVAGEISGDILGAGLIQSLSQIYPDATFIGIAGELMQQEGCKSLYPMEMLSVMGLVEVLSSYRQIKSIQNNIINYFINTPPDIFIGIDAPDFNLTVSRKLKERGVKTVQYVSPSVWAWRQYRINKIVNSVGLMLTLFPFEKQFYDDYDIQVEFVGHRLADLIPIDVSQLDAKSQLGLGKRELENYSIIALLPGSRMSEIKKLAQPFIDTALSCQKENPRLIFLLPCVSTRHKEYIQTLIDQSVSHPNIILVDGQSREVMAASDAVLLASGTAALEALLLKKPMIVVYKISPITYWIVKRLAQVPYFSLPNLLSGEKIVEELVQNEVNETVLTPKVLDLLNSDKWQEKIETFHDIHLMLKKDASLSAAKAIEKYLNT